MDSGEGRDGGATPPVRMIASDLDGTLLAPDGHVSARTVAVLRRAHEEGIVVVAATGRSHRTAAPRLAPVGVIDWAVCSNGAVLYDLAAGVVVDHHPIADSSVAATFAAVAESFPDAGFAWETPDGFVYEEAFLAVMPSLDLREGLGRPRPPRPDAMRAR